MGKRRGLVLGCGGTLGAVPRGAWANHPADVVAVDLERVTRVDPTAEGLVARGPHLMDRTRRLSVLEASSRSTRKNLERVGEGARP